MPAPPALVGLPTLTNTGEHQDRLKHANAMRMRQCEQEASWEKKNTESSCWGGMAEAEGFSGQWGSQQDSQQEAQLTRLAHPSVLLSLSLPLTRRSDAAQCSSALQSLARSVPLLSFSPLTSLSHKKRRFSTPLQQQKTQKYSQQDSAADRSASQVSRRRKQRTVDPERLTALPG